LLEEAQERQEFITGLIYIDESRPTLPALQHLTETPLAHLPESVLRPSRESLAKIMSELA
jgi:2-oxoglutarate ferredoxin oxidoreductase subunit beta